MRVGAGEMRARVAAFAWDRTPLGGIRGWPEPLRTVVDLLLDTATPAALLWGPEGIHIYNDAYIPVLGPRHPAALGRPYWETFADARPVLEPAAQRAFAGDGVTMADQLYPLLRDGTYDHAWFAVSFTPVRDGEGAVAGVLAVMVETTARVLAARRREQVEDELRQRKAAEEALRRAHEELEDRVRQRTSELAQAIQSLQEEVLERRAAEEHIKTLLERLLTAQEEERRRIARDLHDQLGQPMTALRMHLQALGSIAGAAAMAEQARRTQALAEELDQSIDFLTWDLRPAGLDHHGLAAALRDLVRQWSERFRITAEYHALGVEEVRLSPHVEINLYRLVQEALHNVYKHAGATLAGVSLERRGEEFVVIVEDNGRGFDPEQAPRGDRSGVGLMGMRERAMLVGGTFEIESAPGHGTIVYVRVPLERS